MRWRVFIISSAVVMAGILIGLGSVWYLKVLETNDAQPVSNNDNRTIPINTTDTSTQSASLTVGDTSSSINNNKKNVVKSNNNTGNSYNMNANYQNTDNNTDTPQPLVEKPSLSELEGYNTNYKAKDTAFFRDIRVGDGAEANRDRLLTVDYRGWLTNGQIFDQSYPTTTKAGQHFQFTLGKRQVIMGWEEGFQGMKVGGKRRIVVPPAVGYGATSTGGIPANSLLVFDVELLGVE
jgi:FKBP-type peptidyl-prolyl cis-trans isomerase